MTITVGGGGMFSAQSVLMPQESMLELKKIRKELLIGIPKEVSFQENRIALAPDSVAVLINNGHQVMIETGAGNTANFTDTDYSEAGARIVYSAKEVYTADLILKIAPPTEDELELMQEKQTLFSVLQITMQNKEFFQKLTRKKITAVAYEYMKDDSSLMPVIQAMSEIVGRTSILIASELLSNTTGGKGEMLGSVAGVPPSEVVIIGAGTVGENAARTAMGLGAEVKIFDNNMYKLRRILKNLGSRVYTSTLTQSTLLKALKSCDVAIGAVHAKTGRTPVIVTEEMVSEMRFGSVIIDVSIDQGGCFETSKVTNHTHPVFRDYGVVHYCVPNIASRVAKTASFALSNIFTPILLELGDQGGLENLLWKDAAFRSGVYLFRGTVTNKYVSELFKLPFRDLNLLMASFTF
jgi:alanine dehydrogenase